MSSNSLRLVLLAATIAGLVGCDPNPGGPAAPEAPGGAAASPSPPDRKAATKGAVPLRVAD